MIRKFLTAVSFAVLAGVTLPSMAADDPSMHDIYTAAEAGRLDEAQTMIGKVLADHPQSGKAHYVAAELDARQGRLDAARSQLAEAEKLSPGLAFAKPDALRALRAQLGVGSGSSPALVRGSSAVPARASGGHSPLLMIGLVALVVFVLYLIFRRRQAPPATQYAGTNNPYYGGSGGYAGPPAGNGIGSGVVGGLATGLAVGAGVVAGEALAHRLAGDEREHDRYGASSDTRGDSDANSNMGGNDFGVSDSSSWDDSSGGGVSDSGGGDDWS